MRPKPSKDKKPAEQVVKDIRRATRRHFSAEDKIRIVLDGLSSIEAISAMDAEGYSAAVLALDRLYERREDEAGRMDDLREEIAAMVIAGQTQAQLNGPSRAGRSPLTVALLVGIGVGFVLLVGVFIRAGARAAARDPETRMKVDQIRDALLLRHRT